MIRRWLKAAAVVVALFCVAAIAGLRRLLAPFRTRSLSVSPANADAPSPREHSQRAGRGESSQSRWKKWLLFGGTILTAIAILGLIVTASGIISIKASSRHFAITRWFLNFAKERSVATHTLGMETPSLDEPWMVLKGAGHYHTGCFPCHGSPEMPYPRIPQAMTPRPPYLPPEISQWDANDLFYIVKHGIKFTGMPAWPALQRDDEVWAMVAFLRRLPELDKAQYRRLVHGETHPSEEVAPLPALVAAQSVPRAVTTSCARCHGFDGAGRGSGAFPKLAGQKPAYLLASMEAYAKGERHSGIMEPVAVALSAQEIRALVQYYSDLTRAGTAVAHTNNPTVERGGTIANVGIASRGIPACVSCHGPSTIPKNPIYPLLAGQYPEYLILQLDLFSKKRRGGTPYAHIMHHVAGRLTPEEMHAVAAYFGSLQFQRESPGP